MDCIKIKRYYLFFPDKEKTENGYKPDARLRFRIRWDKYKVDFNVGYRVKLSQWDKHTQRCRVKTVNFQKQSARQINRTIQSVENMVENVFTSFELKGIVPSPNQLKDKFYFFHDRKNGLNVKQEKILLDYFDKFVETEGDFHNWTNSTYRKFQSIRNHLEEYDSCLTFKSFNNAGLVKFIAWLRDEKQMRNTTILQELSFVKWFLRWATANDICHTLDFLQFKPKLKTSQKKIIFLDWSELLSVYNHEFPSTQKHLERVRDVFCFCCFTSLRYSDVVNLKRSDVFKDYISLTTIKTADSIKIELNNYSRSILDKYANQKYPNNRALPVISNQKMNNYLKKIGKACGINQPITETYYKGNTRIEKICPKYKLLGTHVGRRTFICNALSLGIPPQVIMKWTGHSDYKAMKPYIDIADSVKFEAMKAFNK